MSNFVAKNRINLEYPPTEIAIVGFGYWGRIIANNLNSTRCVNIKYIVDNFEPNREAATANYPNVNAVANLSEALADDELDLVVIATPTDSHFNIAVETLAAGKHVFVEKPFVRRLDEAFELKLLAKKVDRHIFVDHTFVFTNEVQEIKKIIDEGVIGDVHMIDSCRMNFGKFQPDVNVAWDLGPHDLSIIKYLTGSHPSSLQADGSDCLSRGIEDTVNIALEFPGALKAYLHWSWISPRKERRMIVSGSEKMLIYDDSEPEMKIRVFDHKLVADEQAEGQFNFDYQTGDIHIPKVGGGSALVREFEYVSSVLAGEPHTKNNVDDAIWVVNVLTECDRLLSSKSDQQQLEAPLKLKAA